MLMRKWYENAERNRLIFVFLIVGVFLQLPTSECFQIPSRSQNAILLKEGFTKVSLQMKMTRSDKLVSRRQVFGSSMAFVGGWWLIGSNNNAQATIMDASMDEVKTFKAGEKLGKEAAIDRFQKARSDLKYLLDNYDEVVANGGGDNVRRYLGTVGVTSGMYGITKVLKDLQSEADDIVEYTEAMNDFAAYLNAADTSCYSANFVEFSAAKTKPEKFFSDAKSDAIQMQKAMSIMATQLNIP